MVEKYQEIFLQARRKEILEPREHYCHPLICDPQNETTLRRRGLIPNSLLPMTRDNVFLCVYGNWHICDPEVCMLDQVCPISGASMGVIAEYNSYDPTNPKTYTEPQRKPNKTVATNTEVFDVIENTIDTMLFSSSRSTINSEWVKKKRKIAKKQKDNYVHERHNVPINVVGLAMLESHTLGVLEDPPLSILYRNREKICHYRAIVYQVYEFVKKYTKETKICAQSIAIATLYRMQQSIVIDGVVILPVDEFLVTHLPLMNDLNRFKIDKRKYTKGERLIDQSIAEAVKQNVPLIDIAITIESDLVEEVVFKPTSRRTIVNL